MASSYLTPPSPRRRAIAIALTILVHLALIWALLNLGPRFEPRDFGDALQTFDVAGSAPAPAPRAAPRPRPSERPRQALRTPAPPPPVVYKDAPNVIWLTRDQYAATDISRLKPSTARGEALADAGNDGAGRGDSTAAYGPGEGPGGERLYAAEWYREPTSAELRTFLPPAPPDSWGMIGCRTIPDFQVENCRTLGESPLGSGIATGMRRAAWQFRVRPPRIGGRPQYGTWVRIRIEFTQNGPNAAGKR